MQYFTVSRALAPTLLLLTALAAPRASATVAADLCSDAADPCVVGAVVTLTPDSVIDVGSRALVLSASARLTVPSGTLTLLAGSFRMAPGARIDADAAVLGATVVVRTAGDIVLEASGSTRAHIDVSAGEAPGMIELQADGAIQMAGQLFSNGTGPFGGNGLVTMMATGSVTVTGDLQLKGGSEGGGGSVLVMSSTGGVEFTRPIDLSGGDFGGGDLDVQAPGDITARALINVNGGGLSGDGGEVVFIAGGSAQLLGGVTGDAAGDSEEGGGTGADVQLIAGQAVTVSGPQLSLGGAFPDGAGGSVTIDAGTDVTVSAQINAFGNGIDGCGGGLDVNAGGNVSLVRVETSGSSCGGGRVNVRAGGNLTTNGQITADGATIYGAGGQIVLVAARDLVVGALLRANGEGLAGVIQLQGCSVQVRQGADVRTQGPFGANEVRASGQLTVAGTLLSAVNRFVFRSAGLPLVVTGTVSPAATSSIDPLLPECPGVADRCGDGTVSALEECDDGNNTSCDGCSASCRVEGCGNERIECGEECDLGPQNGVPGSGCDASCRVPPTPGGIQMIPGGTNRNDCFVEWAVRNPGGEVINGFPSTVQKCIDGDPSCDADEASDGSCAFEVATCLAVRDARLPLCQPNAIELVTINSPHPLKSTLAADQANAQTLVDAFESLGVSVRAGTTILYSGQPNPERDACSAPQHIVVPHGQGVQGSKVLEVEARAVGGARMSGNNISLVCEPNPAVCGNGVVELGERCDDGNLASCDGCTATCRVERCGDGIVECGEQCDDGAANGTPASECTATCTEKVAPLRIPGGGSKNTDCLLETAADVAAPLLDRNGLPGKKQDCVDGDPGCDFDPAPGVCRFRIWACLAGDDTRIACVAEAVASTEVRKPSAKELGSLAELRQDLLTKLAALGTPVGPGERCTRKVDVTVPVGRKGVTIQLRATSVLGVRDSDSLKFRCLAPES